MSYIPNTDADRKIMLAALGLESTSSLFGDIPQALFRPAIDLPETVSEIELRRELRALGERNADVAHVSSFLGAGLYNHYVPAVVSYIIGRGEFYTSYTPYQPEISQGTLQATYEFQTLVSQLTGMDVANASMYDGASALAEAALMAADITGRTKVVVAHSVHPEHRQVLQTYSQGAGLEIATVDSEGWNRRGRQQGLRDVLDDSVAAIIVQQPDFFGAVADVDALAQTVHDAGALFVVSVDPISLGILQPPGEYGADIVVAEGQPLGSPLNFGGPLLGLFACKTQFVRRMPGRIVGATIDSRGHRGFVLTLQTREQHIRRDRATSNICTNEALNALAATVYLSALGPQGLRRVAELCLQKAHYAARQIASLPGFRLLSTQPFFKEFAFRCPLAPHLINERLYERRIIGGYELGQTYPELADGLLFCVTEMHTRGEIDGLVQALADIIAEEKSKPSRAIGS